MLTHLMLLLVKWMGAWVTRPECWKHEGQRSPKGLQLEVGARRAPRLLVWKLSVCNIKENKDFQWCGYAPTCKFQLCPIEYCSIGALDTMVLWCCKSYIHRAVIKLQTLSMYNGENFHKEKISWKKAKFLKRGIFNLADCPVSSSIIAFHNLSR